MFLHHMQKFVYILLITPFLLEIIYLYTYIYRGMLNDNNCAYDKIPGITRETCMN